MDRRVTDVAFFRLSRGFKLLARRVNWNPQNTGLQSPGMGTFVLDGETVDINGWLLKSDPFMSTESTVSDRMEKLLTSRSPKMQVIRAKVVYCVFSHAMKIHNYCVVVGACSQAFEGLDFPTLDNNSEATCQTLLAAWELAASDMLTGDVLELADEDEEATL